MIFRLQARYVAGAFAVVALTLTLAHIVVQAVRFASGDDRLYGLVSFLSLGSENNPPTYYASFAILFCAFLLAFIGIVAWRSGQGQSWYWYLLAVVFVFLALDESIQLHERMIEPTRDMFGASGFFYYAWIIPYGIAFAVLAAAYFRFLLRLPRRTAVLFVIAGSLFVTGAIGFEMLGGYVFEESGSANVRYVVLQTIEEVLEMAGIVLFIYALVDYLEASFGELAISLENR
ncbi:MAG: hypothetical protein KJO31_05405 [Gammaproteobacteria bacterium]|nr:hypothetical protein [Gammaproteobacteria bacterium]